MASPAQKGLLYKLKGIQRRTKHSLLKVVCSSIMHLHSTAEHRKMFGEKELDRLFPQFDSFPWLMIHQLLCLAGDFEWVLTGD